LLELDLGNNNAIENAVVNVDMPRDGEGARSGWRGLGSRSRMPGIATIPWNRRQCSAGGGMAQPATHMAGQPGAAINSKAAGRSPTPRPDAALAGLADAVEAIGVNGCPPTGATMSRGPGHRHNKPSVLVSASKLRGRPRPRTRSGARHARAASRFEHARRQSGSDAK
jgi:hypothetical protein